MLLELVIYIIGSLSNFFAQFLPGTGQVPLLLPWGVDEALSTGVSGYKQLSTVFPPFDIVLQAFLVYIGFRLVIQLLKAVPLLGKTLS